MSLTKQDLQEALKDIPTRDEVRVIIKQEGSKAVSEEMESRELVTRDDLVNLATKEDLNKLKIELKDYVQATADTIIEAMDTMSTDHIKNHHLNYGHKR